MSALARLTQLVTLLTEPRTTPPWSSRRACRTVTLSPGWLAPLGAVHGVEAMPVDLVSRHELAWVLGGFTRTVGG